MSKKYKGCGVLDEFTGCIITPESLLDRVTKGKKHFYLNKSVTVGIWHRYKGKDVEEFITIPSSYSWDGASIPSLFTWLIGEKLAPEFALASMVHDFLYERLYHKPTADAIFFDLLQDTKFRDIPPWKEKCMFAAVTLFGGKDYPISAKHKSWRDNRCKIVKSVV